MAKLKIKTKISAVFITLAIYSCEQTSQKIESPIIPTPNFVLSVNERMLLCLDSCGQEFNLDSLYTTTNFNKARSQFQLPEKEQKANLCFNLSLKLNKDSIKTYFKIQFILPNYHHRSSPIFEHKYISGVGFTGSTNAFSTDLVTDTSTLINDLTKYITDLYLEKLDSSNKRKYCINLFFEYNESTYFYAYLSEFITGYIIAQRALSKKFFNKNINELTISEITKLRNYNPLIFKLSLLLKTSIL